MVGAGPGPSATPAVVTGGTRGIGRAIAGALAVRGVPVFLTGKDPERVARAVASLREAGGRADGVALDLADPEVANRLVRAVDAAVGTPHAVILNAGVARAGRFERLGPGELSETLRVNLEAPVAIARAFLPGLLEAGHGHLIFLGSGAADFPPPRLAAYASTKAALRALAASLDLELRERGIRASVVEPIFVRTELGRRPGEATPPLESVARRHPRFVIEPGVVAERVVRLIDRPRPRVSVPAWWGALRVLGLLGSPIVRRALTLAPPRRPADDGPAFSWRE